MTSLYLPILLGTAREGRQSEKAARYILEKAKHQAFETELLDVRDFVSVGRTEAMEHPRAQQWSHIMTRADGLIIVTPEYNHGYPGELKLMIDQIYKEYTNKALAVCGVSSGWTGGVRAVKLLVSVAHTLKMYPIRNALYFPNVEMLFNEDGSIKDPSYEKMTQTMFDDLVWLASALKYKREESH
ncbi:NAD(P)H-dependent oxidoreductase [Candidatus Uhrbacteria bacterium]|nr:NAD(P)H-dependent oxidoreductase [Candidatus Uhrbacteria bacterium]